MKFLKAPYTARNKRPTIASETEILELKAMNSSIEKEISLLKAKCYRYEKLNRVTRKNNLNQSIFSSIKKQLNTLDEILEEKIKAISEINTSDYAASILEIREDIKIYQVELYRNQSILEDKERLLDSLQKQYEMNESNLSRRLVLSSNNVEYYEKELQTVVNRNSKLEKAIKNALVLKAKKNNEGSILNYQMEIESLKSQILIEKKLLDRIQS